MVSFALSFFLNSHLYFYFIKLDKIVDNHWIIFIRNIKYKYRYRCFKVLKKKRTGYGVLLCIIKYRVLVKNVLNDNKQTLSILKPISNEAGLLPDVFAFRGSGKQ